MILDLCLNKSCEGNHVIWRDVAILKNSIFEMFLVHTKKKSQHFQISLFSCFRKAPCYFYNYKATRQYVQVSNKLFWSCPVQFCNGVKSLISKYLFLCFPDVFWNYVGQLCNGVKSLCKYMFLSCPDVSWSVCLSLGPLSVCLNYIFVCLLRFHL